MNMNMFEEHYENICYLTEKYKDKELTLIDTVLNDKFKLSSLIKFLISKKVISEQYLAIFHNNAGISKELLYSYICEYINREKIKKIIEEE